MYDQAFMGADILVIIGVGVGIGFMHFPKLSVALQHRLLESYVRCVYQQADMGVGI